MSETEVAGRRLCAGLATAAAAAGVSERAIMGVGDQANGKPGLTNCSLMESII